MPFCPSSSKMRRTSSTDEMTGLFVVDVTADDIVRTSGIPLRFGSAAVGPDCTFRGVASFMAEESTTDAFKNHLQSIDVVSLGRTSVGTDSIIDIFEGFVHEPDSTA